VELRAKHHNGDIELTVSDDGVGIATAGAAKSPEKRGSDYVAIFVRQLGGSVAPADHKGAGTTVRVRFPLRVVPPTTEGPAAHAVQAMAPAR
jgi:two-component sensor histidine kinase